MIEDGSSLLKHITKTLKNKAQKNINYFVLTAIKLNVMNEKRVVLNSSNKSIQNADFQYTNILWLPQFLSHLKIVSFLEIGW